MMILSFAVVIYDRQNRERTFAKRRAINHTHYVSVAIFKKINLKFYFLKGIRVHPNKRTYAPIGCTRSVLATV